MKQKIFTMVQQTFSRCLVIYLLLLSSSIANGQVPWFAYMPDTVNCSVIRYDVEASMDSSNVSEKESTRLVDWLVARNSHITGYEDFYDKEQNYKFHGEDQSSSGISLTGYTSITSYSGTRGYSLGRYWGKLFRNGVREYGPGYDKKRPIVWFVDGWYTLITNCTARVKFNKETILRGFDFPLFIDRVKRVTIVEEDKNFRDYIPSLQSWSGKNPVLIYVERNQDKLDKAREEIYH